MTTKDSIDKTSELRRAWIAFQEAGATKTVSQSIVGCARHSGGCMWLWPKTITTVTLQVERAGPILLGNFEHE